MWDVLSRNSRKKYTALSDDLRKRFLNINSGECELFSLLNDMNSCIEVLGHFRDAPSVQLLLAKQLAGFGSVNSKNIRKTTAGKEVVRRPSRGGGYVVL
jgi:hypothetical protein